MATGVDAPGFRMPCRAARRVPRGKVGGMKVVVFLFAFAIMIASFFAFAYAFQFGEESPILAIALFTGGILGVSASFAIPFHLLGATD